MIGRLLCALGWHSFSAFGREWIAWQPSAETARLRLAWVIGHDRAATGFRNDVPAPAIIGFWSGVQAGDAQLRVQGMARDWATRPLWFIGNP